jgi:hypothetical protein
VTAPATSHVQDARARSNAEPVVVERQQGRPPSRCAVCPRTSS